MLEQEFGYKPPIPQDIQSRYEAALHGVLRWQNGPWADNVYETNMDHVARMFLILSDIKKDCLNLSSEIDIPTVEHMVYIHDAGEILVGDLTHDRDDYESLRNRWKKREHAAFILLTQQIQNLDVKLKTRELYRRCVTKGEDDKEAQLTDLVDKLQGARFGFERVFNGKNMTDEQRQIRMSLTVELLSKPTTTLLKLVSKETQNNLKCFLRSEFERFARCGYHKEIASLNAIVQ